MTFKKGQNVNGAVLLEPTTVKQGHRTYRSWLCRIHNEHIKIIREHDLRRRKGTRTPPLKAQINRIYMGYKHRCKKRNIFFDLTPQDFYLKSQKNCSYCGAAPANQEQGSSYIYNGLDRKDNRRGYVKSNSIPCCARCNSIKSNILTYEEMLAAMRAIQRLSQRKKSQKRRPG